METSHQYVNFMNRLFSSERSEWIFVIGLVAIGAGFTEKNVISYPTECTTPEIVTMRWLKGISKVANPSLSGLKSVMFSQIIFERPLEEISAVFEKYTNRYKKYYLGFYDEDWRYFEE